MNIGQQNYLQSIQNLTGVDELTAKMIEVVALVSLDAEKLSLLPSEVEVITAYRNQCRNERDYKTSDYLRNVLLRAGHKVKDDSI